MPARPPQGSKWRTGRGLSLRPILEEAKAGPSLAERPKGVVFTKKTGVTRLYLRRILLQHRRNEAGQGPRVGTFYARDDPARESDGGRRGGERRARAGADRAEGAEQEFPQHRLRRQPRVPRHPRRLRR